MMVMPSVLHVLRLTEALSHHLMMYWLSMLQLLQLLLLLLWSWLYSGCTTRCYLQLWTT